MAENKPYIDSSTTLDHLFKELLSKSRDLLYKYNITTKKYEYISSSITKIVGLSPEDLLNNQDVDFFNLLHPDDKPRITAFIENLKTGLPASFETTIEYRTRHMEGHYVWISDNIHAVCDETDKTFFIVGNARDITVQKELEKRLDENKNFNLLLSKNMPFAYFRTNISDGKLLNCNDTLYRMLGYRNKAECLEKCYISEYYPAELREQILKKLKKEGQINKLQVQGKFNNRVVWIEVSAQISPEEGCIEGIFREISILKLLTKIEMKILKLVLGGNSNKEIALELHRSIRTVEDHRSRIMRKLGVHNLAELVLKAGEILR